MSDDPATPTPPLLPGLLRSALRIAVVIAIAVAASFALDWAMTQTEALPEAQGARARFMILTAALVIYALMLSIPFMPGIEIGLSLLVLKGAEIAPPLYVASVVGLCLPFFVGRALPLSVLRRALADLRLNRFASVIDRIAPLPPEARIDLLRDTLPDWLGQRLVRSRYVMLGALMVMPGNVVLGGGGGIAFMAGISRLFRWKATVLTIALVVSPVPLLVWLFDFQIVL